MSNTNNRQNPKREFRENEVFVTPELQAAVRKYYGIDPDDASPAVRDALYRRAQADTALRAVEKEALLSSLGIRQQIETEVTPDDNYDLYRVGGDMQAHYYKIHNVIPEITDEEYDALKRAYQVDTTAHELPVDKPTSGLSIVLYVLAFLVWIGGAFFSTVSAMVEASTMYGTKKVFSFMVFITINTPFFIYGIFMLCVAEIMDRLASIQHHISAFRNDVHNREG